MKLETPFIKMPLIFVVPRLREELTQFGEDEWMAHATGYTGNLSIPLISLDGEMNDAMHGPMKPTAALHRCEYIQQIMTAFGEVFSRSRLMRLDPGYAVPAHADVNYHWYNRVRVHIPITTNEDVLFYCGDNHVHMAAGECWIFDTWTEHTVRNKSDESRVHLVLDTAGSPRFWELAAQGEWPFAERDVAPSEPRLVEYSPGQPVNIRTETYNAPLVQSPGEIENLIRGLIEDLDPDSTSNPASYAEYCAWAKTFVRAWREVWSEHGMKPDGWPLYHKLVNGMAQVMDRFDPELTLKSNGAEAAMAFRGLVLFAAINEEFAPWYLDKDDVPADLRSATRSFNTPEKSADEPAATRVGRNDPCTCGSGKRYKHCHGKR